MHDFHFFFLSFVHIKMETSSIKRLNCFFIHVLNRFHVHVACSLDDCLNLSSLQRSFIRQRMSHEQTFYSILLLFFLPTTTSSFVAFFWKIFCHWKTFFTNNIFTLNIQKLNETNLEGNWVKGKIFCVDLRKRFAWNFH